MWRTSTSSLSILAAGVLAAIPATAAAQELSEFDKRMCRNGNFPTTPPFQLAEVVGDGRAYFLADMDGCPDEGACRVAGSPYVVPGDVVLVSKLRLDHACAYFDNEGGGTAGYVPLGRLRFLAFDANPPASAFLGTWGGGDYPDMTITAERSGFHIAGTAFWPAREGATDYPSIHYGELGDRLSIFGNRARYDDGVCTVDFTLLREWLIAGDNRKCGGANVSFSGVYRRSAG